MKILATFTGLDSNCEAHFAVRPSAAAEMEKLDKSDYLLTIEKPKKKRSQNQNAMLWALVGEIGMQINGSRTDDEDIYCQIIEMAGAKAEYYECVPQAVDTLKKVFRVVKVVQYRENENGVQLAVCKCYAGTSVMSTAEMSAVIDAALSYAEDVGIDSEYWKNVLQ